MGVWDQSYWGGGGTVYFARTGKLNILQVTKKFCRDRPKKCFRNIPKMFFGTYQKNFPDIPKNLPVNIRKICRT